MRAINTGSKWVVQPFPGSKAYILWDEEFAATLALPHKNSIELRETWDLPDFTDDETENGISYKRFKKYWDGSWEFSHSNLFSMHNIPKDWRF